MTLDCYAVADDDEPIFVLRANDPLAADLVREWANRYEIRKLGEQGGEVFERKGLEKSDEALACARARWSDGPGRGNMPDG